MRKKTAVKEMFVMCGGYHEMDKSILTSHVDTGKHIRLVTTIYLIKTENGNVLYDTGWSPALVPLLAKTDMNPQIKEEHSLPECLKQVGLTPKDIDTAVISHLHIDHAGGIQFLADSKLVVQKDEYAYAFYPHEFMAMAYVKADFDFPKYHWQLIDGDEELMPGVVAILADGHSPGFQALAVDLPETGPVILGNCSFPLQDNIDNGILHGITWDPVKAFHSQKRLKTIASMLDGKLLPGHDAAVWKELENGPVHFK